MLPDRLKSAYCGHDASRPWTDQMGGKRAYRGRQGRSGVRREATIRWTRGMRKLCSLMGQGKGLICFRAPCMGRRLDHPLFRRGPSWVPAEGLANGSSRSFSAVHPPGDQVKLKIASVSTKTKRSAIRHLLRYGFGDWFDVDQGAHRRERLL